MNPGNHDHPFLPRQWYVPDSEPAEPRLSEFEVLSSSATNPNTYNWHISADSDAILKRDHSQNNPAQCSWPKNIDYLIYPNNRPGHNGVSGMGSNDDAPALPTPAYPPGVGVISNSTGGYVASRIGPPNGGPLTALQLPVGVVADRFTRGGSRAARKCGVRRGWG